MVKVRMFKKSSKAQGKKFESLKRSNCKFTSNPYLQPRTRPEAAEPHRDYLRQQEELRPALVSPASSGKARQGYGIGA